MAKFKNVVTPTNGLNLTEAIIFGKQILKDNDVKSGNLKFNGLHLPFTIYSCYSDMEVIHNLMKQAITTAEEHREWQAKALAETMS